MVGLYQSVDAVRALLPQSALSRMDEHSRHALPSVISGYGQARQVSPPPIEGRDDRADDLVVVHSHEQ
jgi:hypothetical protein